jgi:glyoxylate/hydroxypyruvate reductase A
VLSATFVTSTAYADDVRAGPLDVLTQPRQRGLTSRSGVMGLGVLGVTGRPGAAAVFEFPVNGWSRTPKRASRRAWLFGPAQRSSMIFWPASRVLVNLLPLTPDTARTS